MTTAPTSRRWHALAPWQREVLCWLVLLAPLVLVLWPLVFAGQAPIPDYLPHFAPWAHLGPATTVWNPLWYDALGQYWPWRTLLHDGLRANALPYWNPYQFSGQPFAANGQSALFYPLNWLCFGLCSVATGFRLTAVGHLWLAGVGTYRVVRELGGRRLAGLTAGLALELSAFMVGWLPLPTLISSAAWLPCAVACVERARRTGDVRWGAAAGACVGLSALAGHPQIWYYTAVTTAAVAAWRLLPRRWAACLAAGVVAGLLSAAPLLPVMELAPHGHRPPVKSADGYRGFLSRSIPLERLATLAVPRFFGDAARGTINPGDPRAALPGAAAGQYWGFDANGAISPGDFAELGLFVGLTTLVLAVIGAWLGGPARLYLTLATLALLLALGTPLNRPLYYLLPGYSAGAGPCRLALVWSFGLAVSAGMGLDHLLAGRGDRRALVVWAKPLGALAVGWLATTVRVGQIAPPLLEATLFARLLGALAAGTVVAVGLALTLRWPRGLALLVALELIVNGWGGVPHCPASRLAAAPARDRYQARDATAAERTIFHDAPRQWGFYRPPTGLLLPPNLATAAQVRDAGGYDSLMLAGTKDRLAHEADGATSPAINGNMLLLGGVPLGVPDAALAQPVEEGHRPLTPRLDPPARLLLDRCNRVVLQSQAGQQTLHDTAYPGWHLLGTDGRELPWHGAVGGFREWQAPAAGVLRWVFRPVTLRLGLFLALCSWALLLGIVLGGRPRPPAGE